MTIISKNEFNIRARKTKLYCVCEWFLEFHLKCKNYYMKLVTKKKYLLATHVTAFCHFTIQQLSYCYFLQCGPTRSLHLASLLHGIESNIKWKAQKLSFYWYSIFIDLLKQLMRERLYKHWPNELGINET